MMRTRLLPDPAGDDVHGMDFTRDDVRVNEARGKLPGRHGRRLHAAHTTARTWTRRAGETPADYLAERIDADRQRARSA
jgi:hypothetical protein